MGTFEEVFRKEVSRPNLNGVQTRRIYLIFRWHDDYIASGFARFYGPGFDEASVCSYRSMTCSSYDEAFAVIEHMMWTESDGKEAEEARKEYESSKENNSPTMAVKSLEIARALSLCNE